MLILFLTRNNFLLSLCHSVLSRKGCVEYRAARSVEVILGVPKKEALEAVKRVFTRCSQDLEPVGRVPYSRKCETNAFREYVQMTKRKEP